MFLYTCSLCVVPPLGCLHRSRQDGAFVRAFGSKDPGVYSHRFILPSTPRFALGARSCDLVAFLKFSCLFLRMYCGYSCQSSAAAVVAPRAFAPSGDAQNILMQLYCIICSRAEVSSQVWGSACAAFLVLKY